MLSKIRNEFGVIGIDNEVIARLAGIAAMEVAGVVGMAAKNMRDGIVQMLKLESLSKGVRLDVRGEHGLVINLHIIIEYGTNISAISDTLMSNVKYKIEQNVGIKVHKVNIFIEGIRINR